MSFAIRTSVLDILTRSHTAGDEATSKPTAHDQKGTRENPCQQSG